MRGGGSTQMSLLLRVGNEAPWSGWPGHMRLR